MSYDAIMSKASDVQDAAVEAALQEQIEWRMSGHDVDEADADSYKTTPHAWPSDPMDTDIIFGIPDKFEWFALRLAGSVSGARSKLEDMTWTLAAAPDIGIGEQQDRLVAFAKKHPGVGDTVDAIGDYMIQVGNAQDLQEKLRDELALALDVAQELLNEAEEKVIQIADDTIDLLENGSGGSSAVLLSLLSTGLGIGSAIASGGTSITLAILSSLTGGASDMTGEKEKNLTVSGYSVTEILDSMSQALEDAQEQLEEREDEIDKGLRSDLDLLQDNPDDNKFWETIVPGNAPPEVRMPAPDPDLSVIPPPMSAWFDEPK